VILTRADSILLEVLSTKTRVATRDQAVRVLARGGVESRRVGRRRLHVLSASGILACEDVPARPLLDLRGPLVAWRPGLPQPDLDALAWTLEKRWQEPLATTRVYFAGREGLRLHGGVARGHLTNINQVSHDLHVTEVYLRLLAEEPALAAAWVGEEELGETRLKYQKQPDAVLCDEDGRPRLAIEFGGLYGVEKLSAFHRDMDRRGLPYEIW
jgi:hypothetical protein